MSEKLITDGTYALSVKEYTGELEPGQGIDITQNVISVTGKQDTLTFGYDENNRITKIDNHDIGGSGSDETVLWEGKVNISSSPIFDLSEDMTNFSYIELYGLSYTTHAEIKIVTFNPLTMSEGVTIVQPFKGGGNILRFNVCFLQKSSNTKLTIQAGAFQVSIQSGSSTTSTNSGQITKIVGINRKA